MIDHKLTPNEVARYEIYHAATNALYDGAAEAYPDMTEREADATDIALAKQSQRLYKLLGIAKIQAKQGIFWDRD